MKIRCQESILVGEIIAEWIIDREWQTAGWFGPAESGYYGHHEFATDFGAIIDLRFSERGPLGWEVIEE